MVSNFVSNRRTILSFDGERTEERNVGTGVPQGSLVSLILFLIYLQPIFCMLEAYHPNIITLSYVDDVKLSANTTIESNVEELKSTTQTLFKWAAANGIS